MLNNLILINNLTSLSFNLKKVQFVSEINIENHINCPLDYYDNYDAND